MSYAMQCECCGTTAIKPDYHDWIVVKSADPDSKDWQHACSWLCLLGLLVEEEKLSPDEVVDALLMCAPSSLEEMSRATEGRAT